MQKKRVIIIGARIAGLATANFLVYKLDYEVKVFERAHEFIPTVGAGFGISPNGQRVLKQLRYMQDFDGIRHEIHTLIMRRTDGSIIGQADLTELSPLFGHPMTTCKRADLIKLLAEKLPSEVVHYDKNFVSLERDNENGLVIVILENGEAHVADIVIGADGIRSPVAAFVTNTKDMIKPHFAGYQVHWGTIYDLHDQKKKQYEVFPKHTITQVIGNGAFFITFLADGGDNNESKVRCWALLTHASEEDVYRNTQESRRECIMKHVEECEMFLEVKELIDATPSEHILQFGLYDRDPFVGWSNKNVVLVGDAAHATLPTSAGQGANMALEDAYVLFNCLLSADSVVAAFEEYDKIRYQRTADLILLGQRVAKIQMLKNEFSTKN